MAAFLFVFFACTAPVDKAGGDDTSAAGDTGDTGDTADSADSGATFGFELPAFESSVGHERAEECDLWMPAVYECTGPNPPVVWSGIPDGATSLVLVLDDPDANDFAHWAVYGVPVTETGLAEGISGQDVPPSLPTGAVELENGSGFDGYLGSCPPAVHRYRWRLWAVDDAFSFTASGSASRQFRDLADAAEAAAVGSAGLCHLYGPE